MNAMLGISPEDRARFERKFLVADLDQAQITRILRTHPAGFSEIHHQRHINNIYFDTLDSDAQVVMQSRDVILAPQSGGFMATLREPIQTAKDRNQILGKPRRVPTRDQLSFEHHNLLACLGQPLRAMLSS